MTTTGYTTTFLVDQTPEEAFAAILDVRGWWSGEIDGRTDQLGEEFRYRHGDVHSSTQRITELVPGRVVVWRVLDAYLDFTDDPREWVGTEVRFDVSRIDGHTQVRFTHDLNPEFECFDICSNAWAFYVGTSLRSLITTGRGQPMPKEERTAS